jgi:hypothetical protein
MNEGKKGIFVFPNSFILLIGYIRYSFDLPYRQTQGIIKATGKRTLSNSPSYGYICKRINRIYIDIKEGTTHDDEEIEIASLFKEFLRKEGYNVVAFTDWVSAFEYFKEIADRHSFMITDLRLTGTIQEYS